MSGQAKRDYTPRIQPRNLRDMPTVLSTEEVADVLRVSVDTVRELTNAGELRRLTYSRVFLFSAVEVERFIAAKTDAVCRPESPPEGEAKNPAAEHLAAVVAAAREAAGLQSLERSGDD